jgi:hypothetical protein
MMMKWIMDQRVYIGICVAMLLLCGCGKKSDEQQAQSSEQSSTEAGTSAMNQDTMPQSTMASKEETIADVEARNKQALMEMNQGKDIKPVDMGKLKDMLPAELAGMKRTNASSERNQMMGIDMAKAEANYEAGEGSIKIAIMDMGNLSGSMRMGMAGWTMQQYSRETDSGYEKTITYNGYKGVEQYDNSSKQGELRLFVADRFIVELNGYQTTMEAMKKALDKIDLKKLAALASD